MSGLINVCLWFRKGAWGRFGIRSHVGQFKVSQHTRNTRAIKGSSDGVRTLADHAGERRGHREEDMHGAGGGSDEVEGEPNDQSCSSILKPPDVSVTTSRVWGLLYCNYNKEPPK